MNYSILTEIISSIENNDVSITIDKLNYIYNPFNNNDSIKEKFENEYLFNFVRKLLSKNYPEENSLLVIECMIENIFNTSSTFSGFLCFLSSQGMNFSHLKKIINNPDNLLKMKEIDYNTLSYIAFKYFEESNWLCFLKDSEIIHEITKHPIDKFLELFVAKYIEKDISKKDNFLKNDILLENLSNLIDYLPEQSIFDLAGIICKNNKNKINYINKIFLEKANNLSYFKVLQIKIKLYCDFIIKPSVNINVEHVKNVRADLDKILLYKKLSKNISSGLVNKNNKNKI